MRRLSVIFGFILGFVLVLDAIPVKAAGDEPDKFIGLYAGLVAGIGFVDGTWSDGSFPPVATNFDSDGGLAGVTVGYNWLFDNFLVGLEADITTLGLSENGIPCGAGATCAVDTDAMATARARLGYVFGETGQFAVYATGGIANVWASASGAVPPGPISFRTNFSELTYAVGGGFEGYVMDTNWISTKLEVLYVGLDISKNFFAPAITVVSGPDRLKLEDLLVVRGGFNVHF